MTDEVPNLHNASICTSIEVVDYSRNYEILRLPSPSGFNLKSTRG